MERSRCGLGGSGLGPSLEQRTGRWNAGREGRLQFVVHVAVNSSLKIVTVTAGRLITAGTSQAG